MSEPLLGSALAEAVFRLVTCTRTTPYRATSEFYDVVSIKAGRYELMNPEISEEGGVYGYSADFVLWTDATDGRSGPGFNGRIKFELVEGKWKNPTYHLNSVR